MGSCAAASLNCPGPKEQLPVRYLDPAEVSLSLKAGSTFGTYAAAAKSAVKPPVLSHVRALQIWTIWTDYTGQPCAL